MAVCTAREMDAVFRIWMGAVAAQRATCRQMAEDAWAMFNEDGALRVVEACVDDVPDGKLTDLRCAVKARPAEKLVFAFMEWSSREAYDAAQEKTMKHKCMKPPEGMELPFDTKRMLHAGFDPIVTLEK